MNKYFPLCDYLSKCEHMHIELTFLEIEHILGFKLPYSAYNYSAWWANSGHSHASTWTDNGFTVDNLNLSSQRVTFSKNNFIKPNTVHNNSALVKHKPIMCKENRFFEYNGKDITVEGNKFHFIQQIMPKCDETGKIIKFFPQEQFDNKNNLPLLPNGYGAFCHFSIIAPSSSGVYLWIVDNEIIYIGETENLCRRFNTGYGNISPRNCYKGGQSTNCKMNKLVLELYEKGKYIDLYFYETKDYKKVELQLLKKINTPYNVKDNL